MKPLSNLLLALGLFTTGCFYSTGGISAKAIEFSTDPFQQVLPGESKPVEVKPGLGEKVHEYMRRMEAFGVSGALLVAKDGKVLLEEGYGLANKTTGAKISAHTPFIIGSLTKEITAAAILKLEMQGKLKVTDTLGKFFPDAPKEKLGITLHQLLTHTAGLTYLGELGLFQQLPRPEVMKAALRDPMIGKPGEKYSYSNPGYTLLAGVIEKASGMTYEEYLRKELFIPAGMKETGFQGETIWASEVLPHSYTETMDEGIITDFPGADMGVGAGTVVSTVGDLYKWITAVNQGKILDATALQKYYAPHVQAQGPFSYAYGWNVGKTIRGTGIIAHAGDIGGYNADLRQYTDEKVTLIFLSNQRVDGHGYREAVMNNVSQVIAGGNFLNVPEVTSKQVPSVLAGSYTLSNGGEIKAWIVDSTLFLGALNAQGINVLANMPMESAEAAKQFTESAITVLNGLAKNDGEPIKAVLHPSIPVTPAIEGFLALVHGTDSTGALKSFDVIGTAVLSPASAKTYFRLNFNNVVSLHSFSWSNGKIMANDDDLPVAFPVKYLPESKDQYVAFDVFSGKTNRVKVVESGNKQALQFENNGSEVLAKKV